jgi:pimeloyl-ACP methyl ester carboxylesterase
MSYAGSDGCDVYYEEAGEGVPILLIPPAGATASTWESLTEALARIGRVITYDRRGYARTGGEPVRLISTHTADAAAILEYLQAAPASWSVPALGRRSRSTSRCVVRTSCRL